MNNMKKKYAYILSILITFLILNGFTSDNNFPAPIKEPSAALYFNFSTSGIFDEDSNLACEEIASNTASICNLRNTSNISLSPTEYKESALNFLNNSIVNGFLKLHEVYFYFKDYEEYALIAKGDFDINTIAEKSKAEMTFDKEDRLLKVFTTINTNMSNAPKMLLQANKDTLVICPEKSFENVIKNLEENKNQLDESFKTFIQMVKFKPAISAEVKLQKILENQTTNDNIPKSVVATRLIRLFVAAQQNKIQFSIPEEKDREELREQIQNLTSALNNIFENKTDYKIEEGKTSLFVETKANEEQMQSISRKAMAFMLHFFVKNISSNQQ